MVWAHEVIGSFFTPSSTLSLCAQSPVTLQAYIHKHIMLLHVHTLDATTNYYYYLMLLLLLQLIYIHTYYYMYTHKTYAHTHGHTDTHTHTHTPRTHTHASYLCHFPSSRPLLQPILKSHRDYKVCYRPCFPFLAKSLFYRRFLPCN
jgi:hypothetical protein